MSIDALFWFGNIHGLSLLLHYISLTFPNQTIIKCLQSKKVRKRIICGQIGCDDVVSQQSRSERVYTKITWLSLAFQDRVVAYVLPFILTFFIALRKGSQEISLSDYLLSYFSRKTGGKTESQVNTQKCAAAVVCFQKYPYHGRHLGIPKGRRGYIDWNSGDMGGSLDWNSEGMGGFQESNFQFGVVKSLQEKLVKNDLSKDDDSLVNTRHVQLNQHAGYTFQWSWSIKCLC